MLNFHKKNEMQPKWMSPTGFRLLNVFFTYKEKTCRTGVLLKKFWNTKRVTKLWIYSYYLQVKFTWIEYTYLLYRYPRLFFRIYIKRFLRLKISYLIKPHYSRNDSNDGATHSFSIHTHVYPNHSISTP